VLEGILKLYFFPVIADNTLEPPRIDNRREQPYNTYINRVYREAMK
jgi:hypothetical protein